MLREASRDLVWDKSGKPDADTRAQMMFWSFVQGFAQLSLSGKFSKDAMKDLTILDVVPDFRYRQGGGEGRSTVRAMPCSHRRVTHPATKILVFGRRLGKYVLGSVVRQKPDAPFPLDRLATHAHSYKCSFRPSSMR